MTENVMYDVPGRLVRLLKPGHPVKILKGSESPVSEDTTGSFLGVDDSVHPVQVIVQLPSGEIRLNIDSRHFEVESKGSLKREEAA